MSSRRGDILGDVAEFLTGSRVAAHIERSLQVVLFTDIAGSTERAGCGRRRRLAQSALRVPQHRARRPRPLRSTRGQHPRRRLLRCGRESFDRDRNRAGVRTEAASLDLDVRSGLHLGEIEQQGDDFAGLAVHIGARISALAEPGEILVSQTVRDALVGSGIEWTSRGVHHLKGVPDEWRTYAVAN